MEFKDYILLVLGFALSITASGVWQFLYICLPVFTLSHSTEINGFWLSWVDYSTLDSSRDNARVAERTGYNFYKIRETSGRVFLYTEHADSMAINIRVLYGHGVFKSPTLSAFYYFKDRDQHETGVHTFMLRSTPHGGQILVGCFSQFKYIGGTQGGYYVHQGNDYTLVRVNLPFRRHLRRLVGLKYFNDFTDMAGFVNGLPLYLQRHLHVRKPLEEFKES